MLKTYIIASSLLISTVGAIAAPVSAKHVALICPVTGDKIASIKAAVGHSIYKGKTYYFCCEDCKPQFDKNPAKYAKPAK